MRAISRLLAILVLGLLVLSIAASFGAKVSQWQTRQELAANIAPAAEIERRLQELRSSDPKTYLAELKAAGDPRWEPELQALNPQGRNEEAERKAEIARLLDELKTVQTDLDKILALYSRLSTLDPMNPEYKLKRDEAAQKAKIAEAQNVKIAELLAELKTIPATDLYRSYTLYLNLTILDSKNEEYENKRQAIANQIEHERRKGRH
jgi:hypothetical protein